MTSYVVNIIPKTLGTFTEPVSNKAEFGTEGMSTAVLGEWEYAPLPPFLPVASPLISILIFCVTYAAILKRLAYIQEYVNEK